MITRSNAWVLTALPESAAVSPPLKVRLQLPHHPRWLSTTLPMETKQTRAA